MYERYAQPLAQLEIIEGVGNKLQDSSFEWVDSTRLAALPQASLQNSIDSQKKFTRYEKYD